MLLVEGCWRDDWWVVYHYSKVVELGHFCEAEAADCCSHFGLASPCWPSLNLLRRGLNRS